MKTYQRQQKNLWENTTQTQQISETFSEVCITVILCRTTERKTYCHAKTDRYERRKVPVQSHEFTISPRLKPVKLDQFKFITALSDQSIGRNLYVPC